MRKYRSNLHYIATIGVLVALIEACKLAMAHIPNVELTSFWLIIFTVFSSCFFADRDGCISNA